MAILKTFLCMCNTRTGSLISGCYTLAISLLCLVYFLFRYVGHKLVEDSAEYKGIIYVGFVLYGFMIVSSLIIIPGVQLDKRYLLLPWIYIVILVVLYDTGSVALLTTVHMEREKTLHIWEIVWLFFYLFRLAANCYCFTCVVSQYQELSDGRGTYDFLYKPHRRSRFRNSGQFDIDTFDLPFGVHLPPYSEEDTTEHSPPLYSQIFPQTQNQSDSPAGGELQNDACQSFTQQYSNDAITQRCLCQRCVQNYSIQPNRTSQSYIEPNAISSSLQTSRGAECAANSCSDICDCCSISPHCEYCACSENGDDSGYVDIEYNPERGRRSSSNLAGNALSQASGGQRNSQSILRYPILIKNGGRTRKITPRDGHVLSGGVLYNSNCDRYSETENISRHSWNSPHCYEVTVNVEWI